MEISYRCINHHFICFHKKFIINFYYIEGLQYVTSKWKSSYLCPLEMHVAQHIFVLFLISINMSCIIFGNHFIVGFIPDYVLFFNDMSCIILEIILLQLLFLLFEWHVLNYFMQLFYCSFYYRLRSLTFNDMSCIILCFFQFLFRLLLSHEFFFSSSISTYYWDVLMDFFMCLLNPFLNYGTLVFQNV